MRWETALKNKLTGKRESTGDRRQATESVYASAYISVKLVYSLDLCNIWRLPLAIVKHVLRTVLCDTWANQRHVLISRWFPLPVHVYLHFSNLFRKPHNFDSVMEALLLYRSLCLQLLSSAPIKYSLVCVKPAEYDPAMVEIVI